MSELCMRKRIYAKLFSQQMGVKRKREIKWGEKKIRSVSQEVLQTKEILAANTILINNIELRKLLKDVQAKWIGPKPKFKVSKEDPDSKMIKKQNKYNPIKTI